MNDAKIVMDKILELLDNPEARMENGMITWPHDHMGGKIMGGILRMGMGQRWVAWHSGMGLPMVRRFYLSDPNFFDKIVETLQGE